MKVLVLAGGQGTRLFPLSRREVPKQFVRLGGKSLFQRTLERHRRYPIYVSLRKEYLHLAEEQAQEVSVEVKLIEEPSSKNTFPAITWALYNMGRDGDIGGDDILAVTPADHYIEPEDLYLEDLRIAEGVAGEGFIVTFGVRPRRPDTGFGYIKLGKSAGDFYLVEEFVEKPPLEKAEEFVKSGRYMWNSGIFLFSLNTFKGECRAYKPTALELLEAKDPETARRLFDDLGEEPVDKAIVEKSSRVACVPFRANWSDVGTFKGLYEVFCNEKRCVVLSGDVLSVDSKDILVSTEDRPVVVVGIDNVAVINTKDYILVASLDSSQTIKEVQRIIEAGSR